MILPLPIFPTLHTINSRSVSTAVASLGFLCHCSGIQQDDNVSPKGGGGEKYTMWRFSACRKRVEFAPSSAVISVLRHFFVCFDLFASAFFFSFSVRAPLLRNNNNEKKKKTGKTKSPFLSYGGAFSADTATAQGRISMLG
jgi:hypothetical protein